jgi:hypothetical protein
MKLSKTFVRRRAVLISGGIEEAENHKRYLNDLKAFYACLTSTRYGFDPSQIQVVYANGGSQEFEKKKVKTIEGTKQETLAALDRSINGDSQNPPLSSEDLLVVFTTNHGVNSTPHRLMLWGQAEFIEPNDLGSLLSGRDHYFLGIFCHCYGARMFNRVLQNTDQDKCVVVAASQSVSFALPPDEGYDAFAYHFTSALTGVTPHGYAADSDMNKDGHVHMEEAFKFACKMNTTQDKPKIEDHNILAMHQMTLEGLL